MYIFRFLHQTTTLHLFWVAVCGLYIFRFLHQTTTVLHPRKNRSGCISFVSYIKPQLYIACFKSVLVVYLSFPTSNHNSAVVMLLKYFVVYLSFPTSNHNGSSRQPSKYVLYIFRFLHQTTTHGHHAHHVGCCISFVSYIKPQRQNYLPRLCNSCISFVSYIKPQQPSDRVWKRQVVYLSFPTSNHNSDEEHKSNKPVVYLSFPTSNHNGQAVNLRNFLLYIFRFLHQTTTVRCAPDAASCCISFVSYIKPQLPSCIVKHIASCISFVSYIKPQLVFCFFSLTFVVYLSFPTSNHNTRYLGLKHILVVYLSFPTSNHNL